MEALYAKLYNKYSKLKKDKELEIDKLNCEQEKKFVDYVSASEELVEYLRDQNDRLREQVSELRGELASIRSAKDEQHIEYQKRLMEENQRNRELSEEIDRLRSLQEERLSSPASNNKFGNTQLNASGGSHIHTDASDHLTIKKTRKRRRESLNFMENTSPASKELTNSLASESLDQSLNQTEGSVPGVNMFQPACCIRKSIDSSGGDASMPQASCMFQDLLECAVGLKFSCVVQNEELCVSAVHESSGYSFSLTWTKNSRGEPEFLYHVLSLGTFQRVAPEWMGEVIKFSRTMSHTFFEKVACVINLKY